MGGLFERLAGLLSVVPEYVVDGRLNKNLVAELARKYDARLLQRLMGDDAVRERFFSEVSWGERGKSEVSMSAMGTGLVFRKDTFLQFISQKEFLPDSYTAFEQKIGLAAGNGMVRGDNRVVLNWPYKDCVLEGGQDKEDAKREEVFFNEILAPDEITTLLDEKVFTNWKRYDKDGEHELSELKPEDNLVMRGNNLLVLHSLRKWVQQRGGVKMIYIDPPYNTQGDSFRYNDHFNHATWLTFMKNRLQVARGLLADDGVILVQIDQDEGHYLKVLMDEVLGRDNFRNEIIWSYRTGGASKKTTLPKKHDVILCYSKTSAFSFNGMKERQYLEKPFMGSLKDERGRFYVDTLLRDVVEGIVKVPQEDGSVREYNVRPVLNLSGERVENFQSQKPEGLIHLLLDLTTKPGDLVMDYHLGSGTTAAVCQKTGRQYIGIEQMNYGANDAVFRLEKVVKGEDKSGISEVTEWKGGGSFVYCNIRNDANKFRERAKAAEEKELTELLIEALGSSFLSYRVDPKKVEVSEFEKLTLEDRRRVLLDLVDNNTLYVNYSEIDDETYKVPESDKKHNATFYEG